MTTKYEAECPAASAQQVADWIATRGGVAVWTSIDFSRPGEASLTPAFDFAGRTMGKPSWHYGNDPVIITDPEKIGVYCETLFKVIPVVLRVGSMGLSLKLSDSSQRNLDRTLARCEAKHGSAHWRRGGLDDRPAMSVYYTDGMLSLGEWIRGQREAA